MTLVTATTQMSSAYPTNATKRRARFCFAEGTFIATLRGEVAVEELRVGDLIRARSGNFREVEEVGTFTAADADIEMRQHLSTLTLRRGAICEGLPRRDMVVTEGQDFEGSQKMLIAHALRMATRATGSAIDGIRFVVFSCEPTAAVRVEGLWTTVTPVECAFLSVQDEDEVPQDGDA